jgi:hypothetical protein
MREIRDFAMAGVPLIGELSKNLGKSNAEITKMVSAGKIGFKDVEEAFRTMSSEGGKFYNLMEKQNKSVTGQISNLVDKWQVMINEIGKSNEGVIYGGINIAGKALANYKEIGDTILDLIAIYGTYKAALVAVGTIQTAVTAVQYSAEARALEGLVTTQIAARATKDGLIVGTKAYSAAVIEETIAESARLKVVAASTAKEAEALAIAAATKTAIADKAKAKIADATATMTKNAAELKNAEIGLQSLAIDKSMISSEAQQRLSKLGLVEGSVAYTAALNAEIIAEGQLLSVAVASAEKKLVSAQTELTTRTKILALREADLAAAEAGMIVDGKNIAVTVASLDKKLAAANLELATRKELLAARIADYEAAQAGAVVDGRALVGSKAMANIKLQQASAEAANTAAIKVNNAEKKVALLIAQKDIATSTEYTISNNIQTASIDVSTAATEAKTAALNVERLTIEKNIALANAALLPTEKNVTAATALTTAAKKTKIATEKAEGISAKSKIVIDEATAATEASKAAAITSSTAATAASTFATDVSTASKKANFTWTTAQTWATNILTTAIARLNAVMYANPYGVAVIALAALTYGIYKAATALTAAEVAQERLNDTLKAVGERSSTAKTEMDTLVGTLTNGTSSVLEQVRAWDKLITRYKFIGDNYSMGDIIKMSAEQRNKLFSGILEGATQDDLFKQYEAQIARVRQLSTTKSALLNSYKPSSWVSGWQNTLDAEFSIVVGIQDKIKETNRLKQQANIESLTQEQKLVYYSGEKLLLEKRINDLRVKNSTKPSKENLQSISDMDTQIKVIDKKILSFQEQEVGKNKAYWDDILKKATETRDAIGSIQLDILKKATPAQLKSGKIEGVLPDTIKTYVDSTAQIKEAEKALKVYEKDKVESDKTIEDKKQRLLEQRNQDELFAATILQGKLLRVEEETTKQKLAIADNDYIKTLANIEKRKQERLQQIKDVPGEKWSVKDEENYQKAILGAEEVRLTNKNEINRQSAEVIKNIMDESKKAFLSDIELQEKAINDQYDKWIKDATDAGAAQADIDLLQERRTNELNMVTAEKAYKLSEYYREAFGDISEYGSVALIRLTKKTQDLIDTARETDIEGQKYYIIDIPTLDKEGKKIKDTSTLTVEEFNRLKEKLKEFSKDTREINPFNAVVEGFSALSKAIKSGDTKSIDNAIVVLNLSLESSINKVQDLVSSFDIADEITEDVLNAARNISTGVISMIGGLKLLAISGAEAVKGVERASVILAIISAAIQILSTIFNPIIAGQKKYNEAQKKWTQELIDLQLKYNDTLNEQIRIQEQANIFITDYSKTAYDAAQALTDAQKNYYDTLSGKTLTQFLSDLEVKTGVAKKKFLGITVGSKNIYGSLLEQYPELITSTGEFNEELANTLLGLDGLPKETKNALNALIEYQTEIEEATEAMDSAIGSIAGSISNNLYSALTDAWDAGTDSFQAFQESVSEGLKDIISQMVFNAVFADSFSKLQSDLKQSFGIGGDKDVTDDVATLLASAPELLAAWEEAMTSSENAAKSAGFDWSKTTGTSEGSAGQIQRNITEDTGTELVGLYRRNADDTRIIRDYTRTGIGHLLKIEQNTGQTVIELKNAIVELQAINKNTKGVPTASF